MPYKTLPVRVGAVAPWVNTYISPNYNQGLVIMGGPTGANCTGGAAIAGSGVMGSTHFMPGAYPGPEFEVFAGGDEFALTHGSGFAADIGHIETDYQLSLAASAAGFFPQFFKRPKPAFGTDLGFNVTIAGTVVELRGKLLYGVPAFKDAMDKVCGAWAMSAKYEPKSAQGDFPNMFIPVTPADMGGSTPLTVQVLFTNTGSKWVVYDYSRRQAAMTAANEARSAYTDLMTAALNKVSFGKVPTEVNQLSARPNATLSYELHPDDRDTLDKWWADCQAKLPSLAGVLQPASANPTLAEAYAARKPEDQALSFDDWFVKTQRGGSTTPVPKPAEGKSWWESALSAIGSSAASAVGWAGNSVVDLAKSWGPLGTLAAVGTATGMFGKYTPWLIGIAVGLVLLK